MKCIGEPITNLPWQDRPVGSREVVWRYDANPLIGWNETPSTSRIYNSAVVPYGKGFAGVFRADHKNGIPNLHVGFSRDGIRWDIQDDTIDWTDESGRPYQPYYAYDPRLVCIDGRFYATWCTEFGGAPTIGLGYTDDFKKFVRLENAFVPCNRNGVLFPRKIGGKYVMLSRPSDAGHTPFGDMYASESPDLKYWGGHRKVMSRSSQWWQGCKIGGGPAPIETDEGWLILYHGVARTCNGMVYSMGAALADTDEPSKILYRTKDFLLGPQASYEATGFVPNVVFPCAALCDAATGRIAIYYGAADTHVALAFTRADELIEHMKRNSHLMPGDGEIVR